MLSLFVIADTTLALRDPLVAFLWSESNPSCGTTTNGFEPLINTAAQEIFKKKTPYEFTDFAGKES